VTGQLEGVFTDEEADQHLQNNEYFVLQYAAIRRPLLAAR
jgi:hypothetical protein